jgi:hypothetical protein
MGLGSYTLHAVRPSVPSIMPKAISREHAKQRWYSPSLAAIGIGLYRNVSHYVAESTKAVCERPFQIVVSPARGMCVQLRMLTPYQLRRKRDERRGLVPTEDSVPPVNTSRFVRHPYWVDREWQTEAAGEDDSRRVWIKSCTLFPEHNLVLVLAIQLWLFRRSQ